MACGFELWKLSTTTGWYLPLSRSVTTTCEPDRASKICQFNFDRAGRDFRDYSVVTHRDSPKGTFRGRAIPSNHLPLRSRAVASSSSCFKHDFQLHIPLPESYSPQPESSSRADLGLFHQRTPVSHTSQSHTHQYSLLLPSLILAVHR